MVKDIYMNSPAAFIVSVTSTTSFSRISCASPLRPCAPPPEGEAGGSGVALSVGGGGLLGVPLSVGGGGLLAVPLSVGGAGVSVDVPLSVGDAGGCVLSPLFVGGDGLSVEPVFVGGAGDAVSALFEGAGGSELTPPSFPLSLPAHADNSITIDKARIILIIFRIFTILTYPCLHYSGNLFKNVENTDEFPLLM